MGSTAVDNGASTNDRLLFASDPGYTATELAKGQFSNDAGSNFGPSTLEITYNGFFEIVPAPAAPEPSAWAAMLAGMGLLLCMLRRRGSPGAPRP